MTGAGALRDERGIMGLGVFRLVVILVLVAIAGYEAGAVAFARVQAEELATFAAGEASGAWIETRNKQITIDVAQAAVSRRDPNARVIRSSVEIAPNGNVTLTVAKEARTYLIQHIGFLEGFHLAKGTGTGVPPLV